MAAAFAAKVTGMPRVLLIEDDVDLRDAIEDGLRRVGFEVTSVADGRAGLDAFAADLPDLVLTDVVMDRVEGVEVIRAVVAAAPAVPVFAISGNAEYLRYCQTFGATRVFHKPFRLQALLDAIAATLAEST